MFDNHPESYRPKGRGDSVAHLSFYRRFTEGGSLRSRLSLLGCENARVMVSLPLLSLQIPAVGTFNVFVRHLVALSDC